MIYFNFRSTRSFNVSAKILLKHENVDFLSRFFVEHSKDLWMSFRSFLISDTCYACRKPIKFQEAVVLP